MIDGRHGHNRKRQKSDLPKKFVLGLEDFLGA